MTIRRESGHGQPMLPQHGPAGRQLGDFRIDRQPLAIDLGLPSPFQQLAPARAGGLVQAVDILRDERPDRAELRSRFERYDEQVSSLALGRRACSVWPGAAVGWLPSACLVARVDRLRAAGGFAEDMRVGEDVDLVWRLAADGWRLRYEPASRVAGPAPSSVANGSCSPSARLVNHS